MTSETENNTAEKEILSRFYMGDENALAIIFNRLHKGLFYFAIRLVKLPQVAEDIVAESFIKLWSKRNDFDRLAAIKSFLFIVVKNSCLNEIKSYVRHQHSHEEIKYLLPGSENIFSEHLVAKAELLHRIVMDIEQLPPARRKIFKMIYLQGFSTVEVAKKLNITVNTVRVQKAKGLHTLRGLAGQSQYQ